MDDRRQRYGNHTWEIVIDYQRCPYCGYIEENHTMYQYHQKLYQKDLVCTRCHHSFSIATQVKPNQRSLLLD